MVSSHTHFFTISILDHTTIQRLFHIVEAATVQSILEGVVTYFFFLEQRFLA